MKKHLSVVLFGLCITQSVKAASVINGSFETDSWASPGYQYNLEAAGVTGWTALDPNANPFYPWGINNNYIAATPYGNQYVVLGDGGADAGTSFQQTLTGLIVGNTYELDFAIASEGFLNEFGTGHANIHVEMLSGSVTPAADFAAPQAIASYWDVWAMNSYLFTADSSTVTFSFQDLAATGPGYDVALDNVSISDAGEGNPVPEPTTLLGGIALGVLVFGRKVRQK